jgi:hypothetical protein
VTFAVALWLGRNLWFHTDEWNLMTQRGILSGSPRWLEPYNGHWLTAPILIYKLLYRAFDLRSYIPYIVTGLLFHLCVMHLAYRLARRAGADAWPAVAITAGFGLCTGVSENLLSPFQLTFEGSVALGFLHLLLVDHDDGFDRRDAVALGVGLVALTFSAMSVPLLGASCFAVLLRRGWRAALVTGGSLAAVYLGWLLFWGYEGFESKTTVNPHQVTSFMIAGLRETARAWSHFPLVGDVLLVLLVSWLVLSWWPRRKSEQRAQKGLQLALAAGVVFVFLTAAVGRANVSLGGEHRYTYVATAMLVAPVAAMLTDVLTPVRRRPRGEALIALVSLLAVALPIAFGIRALRSDSVYLARKEQNLRRFVVASAELFREGEPVVSDELHIERNLSVTVELLRAISRTNALGDQTPSENDKRLAAAFLQVALSTDEPGVTAIGRTQLRSVKGGVVHDRSDGCSDVIPNRARAPAKLVLDNEGPGRFSAETKADVTVELIDARGGSSPRATTLRSADPSGAARGPIKRWWVTLDWNGPIEVHITGAPAIICGVER